MRKGVCALLAVVACGRPAPATGTIAPATDTMTPATGTLTAVTEIRPVGSMGSMLADTGEFARRRVEAMRAASAIGRRIKTLEVAQRRIDLTVGSEASIMQLQVIARDSTGLEVNGWSRSLSLQSYTVAALQGGRIIGVRPGTTALRISPMVIYGNDGMPSPREDVVATVQVVVAPAVMPPYTRPGTVPSQPGDVVTAYLGALGAQQWADAASLTHLERFSVLHQQRVAAGRVALPEPEPTLEEYGRMLASSPNPPPRAVIEWQFAEMVRYRAQRQPFGDYSREYDRVTSFRQLSELTIEDAAARWLAARDPRVQGLRESRREGCDSAATMRMYEARVVPRRLVGVVVASDTTAWALVSAPSVVSMLNRTEAVPENLLLRRNSNGAWRVDLSATNGMLSSSSGCNMRITPPRE